MLLFISLLFYDWPKINRIKTQTSTISPSLLTAIFYYERPTCTYTSRAATQRSLQSFSLRDTQFHIWLEIYCPLCPHLLYSIPSTLLNSLNQALFRASTWG